MAKEGYSANERNVTGKALRYVLKGAVELGLIPHNPSQRIKLPKVERPEKTALTREQVGDLLSKAKEISPYWYPLYVLAIDTGARIGELLALQWQDYDGLNINIRRNLEEIGGKLRLKETKTGSKGRRTIPLASLSRTALDERKREEGQKGRAGKIAPLFASRSGGLVLKSNLIQRYWKPLLASANLPTSLRLYDLRHTCATLLLSGGVNVKVVSERLGHSTVELTLKHYSHVLPSMQELAQSTIEAILGTQTEQTAAIRDDWII
jgi:integrase